MKFKCRYFGLWSYSKSYFRHQLGQNSQRTQSHPSLNPHFSPSSFSPNISPSPLSGNIISCNGFTKYDGSFSEDYCWTQGLYTIREAYHVSDINVPYPGVIPEEIPLCLGTCSGCVDHVEMWEISHKLHVDLWNFCGEKFYRLHVDLWNYCGERFHKLHVDLWNDCEKSIVKSTSVGGLSVKVRGLENCS